MAAPSLGALDEELRCAGSRLCLRAGEDSLALLRALAVETGARRVLWNRRYEPVVVARDRGIKAALRLDGLEAESHNSALLHEPWMVCTGSGSPFQVFTPFWRRCKSLPEPVEPLPAPAAIPAPRVWPHSLSLDELALMPRIRLGRRAQAAWTPGSRGAEARLQEFLANAYGDYASRRDVPGCPGTSRLVPPSALRRARTSTNMACRTAPGRAARGPRWRESKFLAELGWREFACHVLFNFPATAEEPMRASFAHFPWKSNARALAAWQHGQTGYPIVDAGMRELWQSGWMHNRVRMVAASFLVKDLLSPWTQGARWFWDTLVDADARHQPARLAVGRGLRRRRGPVLPHIQPRYPGYASSIRRGATCAAGCRNSPSCRTNGYTGPGRRRPGCCKRPTSPSG